MWTNNWFGGWQRKIEGRGARLLEREYDNDGKIITTINSAIFKGAKKYFSYFIYLIVIFVFALLFHTVVYLCRIHSFFFTPSVLSFRCFFSTFEKLKTRRQFCDCLERGASELSREKEEFLRISIFKWLFIYHFASFIIVVCYDVWRWKRRISLGFADMAALWAPSRDTFREK